MNSSQRRAVRRDAEAAALADGEELDAFMLAEDFAGLIDDVALMALDETGLFEEPAVVVIGDEADFHAFLFVGGFEAGFAGDVAGAGLGEFAEGEQEVAELVLTEGEEEIALVLGGVEAASE